VLVLVIGTVVSVIHSSAFESGECF